jgi:hypothetical protein
VEQADLIMAAFDADTNMDGGKLRWSCFGPEGEIVTSEDNKGE